MIEYKFNTESNILEANYIGEVTCDEVINYIHTTKNNHQLPRVLKIISDTRNGFFNFSISDLDAIVDANNQSLENYDTIIDAIIVDNPKNTVLTVLFKQLANTKKYKFEIFATRDAALNWLNHW